MKRILAIHTGGTISMSSHDGRVSVNTTNPVTFKEANTLGIILDEIYPIQKPSPHITLDDMAFLKALILEKHEEYAGIVITHGTDTLEETAYFLDLSLAIDIPVILTGAMRSSNEIGSDGLYNYISAVRVASSESSRARGVTVVFNDEIHAARYVTKTHTSNIATFQSPNRGPIGFISKEDVAYHNMLYPQHQLTHYDPNIRVGIVKAYADLDNIFFHAMIESGYDGLVIEALGQGNMPPSALEGVDKCLAAGMKIVLVSRSFNGVVGKYYSYLGGGYNLYEQGVIFSNGHNGQKARIKLILALSTYREKSDIEELFLI